MPGWQVKSLSGLSPGSAEIFLYNAVWRQRSVELKGYALARSKTSSLDTRETYELGIL